MNKIDILSSTPEELRHEFKHLSIPSYRADQVFQWIYKKNVSGFNDMANLPSSLREKLSKKYYFQPIKIKDRLESNDGTKKFLFELSDKKVIETVLIHSYKRDTICLSTQVGCKFGCNFCASGMKGFVRDLSPTEIVSQILYILKHTNKKIDNYVFMGMGEPLDNYDNLERAITIMNSSWGLEIGARRMTVSTCGIIPGIDRLKDLNIQVNLSISLHAANNKLRDSLVPINNTYPIEELIKSCRGFMKKKGRIITLEYILIKDKNDSEKDIKELSKIAKTLNAKVNLIPYSFVEGYKLTSPTRKDVENFESALTRKRISVTVRRSKGGDIQAACGQLAMRNL
ncbi:MAG: 23S rRNA (adenine(2503)-C(2))-methyltransferase RlmN [Candidatus Omnitrophota bacterium]